ncbi:MAG: nitrilase-related carbon-nitrogen hydrolase [Ignavibacteriota bacterium]
MRIGCVQTNPIFADIEANLRSFEKSVIAADADLLVFPELALTGYFFNSKDQAMPCSAPLGGALFERISEIARKNDVAIITGFLESSGNQLFNSSLAFDKNGKLVGHYRKTHLFYYEKIVFTPGNLGFPVFAITLRDGESVNVGMEICYDWRFPEVTRSLVLKGANVIAIPSNIVTTTGMLLSTLQVRAFENKVIIAFADRVGSESSQVAEKFEHLNFRGESCIVNYNGDILALGSKSEESTTYADVLPNDTRYKNINIFNNIIEDMRPNIYFT